MPQDLTGWIVVLAALALGFVLGRATGGGAGRDGLSGIPRAMVQPSPEVRAAVQAALAAGNKIEAIRLMREGTGMGLKASKEAVERMTGGS